MKDIQLFIQKGYETGEPFICIGNKPPLIKCTEVYQYKSGYLVKSKLNGKPVNWLFDLQGKSIDLDSLGDAILHIPDVNKILPYNTSDMKDKF